MARRIRKQVYDLTASDFEAYPGWVYAMGEEGRDNEDECTVRPLSLEEIARVQPHQQVFVQAAFFFPNGRIRFGTVTLNGGSDPSGNQPAIFLDDGTVLFYRGAIKPSAGDIKTFRARLRKVSDPSLPIHFSSALRDKRGKPLVSGRLAGMYWLTRGNKLAVAK